MGLNYVVKISELANDPKWDDFVVITPGGHHVQTSCWARIKSSLNWKPIRILVYQGTEIIGGAQMLLRNVPLIGKIGYVTKGPLFGKDEPVLEELVFDQIIQIFKQNHCQLMAVQPPKYGGNLTMLLKQNKFLESTLELAPTASLVLDLQQGKDSITSQLHHKTRQYIRQSERMGTKIVEGSFADLDTFYTLHLSTAQRHKFTPYKREYFNLLWENLAPSGWIKLFIALQNDEPLSALIIIPFGDTILSKLSGWNGKDSDFRPNEAVHWAAINWGIDHGFKFFDFEGINREHAQIMLNGGKLSKTQTGFKNGFGGSPVLFPSAYDFLPNPIINWVYRQIPPVVYGDSIVSKTLERFRKR